MKEIYLLLALFNALSAINAGEVIVMGLKGILDDIEIGRKLRKNNRLVAAAENGSNGFQKKINFAR